MQSYNIQDTMKTNMNGYKAGKITTITIHQENYPNNDFKHLTKSRPLKYMVRLIVSKN